MCQRHIRTGRAGYRATARYAAQTFFIKTGKDMKKYKKQRLERDEYEDTQEEIAKEMGISKRRVQQLEERALRKLKKKMEEKDFKREYME